MSTETTQGEALAQADGPRGWQNAAAAAVIVLGAVVACGKVWNYDVFWHLASGRWMLQHGRLLGHDPFSVSDAARGAPARGGPAEWVNVYWLFQLVVAGLHAAGGFAALVLFKMAVFSATLAVPALWLRRRVAPGWLMAVGAWIVLAADTRIRVRPEIVTYLLLAATLVLVESVRRGASPRRLWWLVPINVLWVNVHGLFIAGPVAAWAALAGAGIDRLAGRRTAGGLASGKALLPVAAATAACLLSPWPIKAGLHPLLLWTRLAGHRQLYSYGVTELRPTWQVNPLDSIPVLLALALAAAVVAAVVARRRQVAAGHVLWLLAFAVPAALAVRNLVLFVLPAGLVLAMHGGAWLADLARPRRWCRRLATPATIGILAALAVVAGCYATELVYRWQKRPAARFGLGLVEGIHPVAIAQWLAGSAAEGAVLPVDFGHGGMFIYYAPGRRVWMDGRLEVQSLERFRQHRGYYRKLRSPARAGDASKTPLPAEVRFVVAGARDSEHIEALARCPRRFKPLYADQTGVCFGRVPLPGEQVSWPVTQPLPRGNLERLDRPLRADLGAMLDAETRRRWWRQNVLPAHWRMGAVLYSLRRDRLAVRYLAVAERLKLAETAEVLRILAQSHQRLSEAEPVRPGRDMPADVNLSRALVLHGRIDRRRLSNEDAMSAGLARLRGLINGGQIDAALKDLRRLERLPAPTRGARQQLADLGESLRARFDRARAAWRNSELPGLEPEMRALMLLRGDIGLIDEAIDQLRSDPSPPRRARLLLGDLYLRKGLTHDARQAYAAAGGDDWETRLRLGLCAWADGDFAAALERLRSAAGLARRPEPTAYLALLCEQLGHYDDAAEVLKLHKHAAPRPADPQAERLLEGIARRLGHKPP